MGQGSGNEKAVGINLPEGAVHIAYRYLEFAHWQLTSLCWEDER